MIPIQAARDPIFQVALVSAIITFLLILITSNLASSVVYAGLAAVVTFALVSLIYTKPTSTAILSSSHVDTSVFIARDIWIVSAFFLSAAAIYVIPSMGDNLIWADWVTIPFLNYVRFAGAVLLTTFLPGYFLLTMLDYRRQFKGVDAIVLSYLLSLLATPLLSAVAAYAGLTLIKFGPPLLVSLNFALLIAFLGVRLIAAQNEHSTLTWPASLKNLRLVLQSLRRALEMDAERRYLVISAAGVLGITLAISYRLFLNPPYLIGDQWVHHAVARLYERYGNQAFASQSLVTPLYPNWFHIYLASLFSLSGIPSTNTYFLINFTNIFGLLAFYVLARSFYKRESLRTAAIALALILTSGFGWAYDLWLRFAGTFSGNLVTRLYESSISSYDILFANSYFGSAHPDLTSNLQVIALPALLMLLALTVRDDLKGRTRYALISLLVALAFLGHVAEGAVFVGILLIAVILSRRIGGDWKIAFSTFSGIVIAGMVGAIMSDRSYFAVGAYYLVLGLAAVTLPIALARQKMSRLPGTICKMKISGLSTGPRVKLALTFSLVGLMIWTALLLTWRLSGLANFNFWWTYPYQYVPVYMYPSRFGILGLLAIPAVIFLILIWRREVRGFSLLCAFGIVSIALGRIWMAGPGFWLTVSFLKEFRFDKYVAITLTLPTALFIWKSLGGLAGRKSARRLLLGAFSIAIILFSGYASTILYSEFTTLAYTKGGIPNPNDPTNALAFSMILSHELSPEELAAIQYVADNLPPGEAVAVIGSTQWTPSGFPYAKITYMAGLFQNQTFSLSTLYGLTNKSGIYQKLADARVHLVYLTQDDLMLLSAHPALYQAVTELPIAFSNAQVTIYDCEL